MSLGARASALIASSLAHTRLAWLSLHSSEDCPHCSDSSRLIALCLRTVVCKVLVFNSCTGNPERVFWMGGQWSGIACTGSRPHLSKAGGCKETRALNVFFLAVESTASCWGNGFPNPSHTSARCDFQQNHSTARLGFSMWPGLLPGPGRRWR